MTIGHNGLAKRPAAKAKTLLSRMENGDPMAAVMLADFLRALGYTYRDMCRFVKKRTSLSDADIDSLLYEGEGMESND